MNSVCSVCTHCVPILGDLEPISSISCLYTRSHGGTFWQSGDTFNRRKIVDRYHPPCIGNGPVSAQEKSLSLHRRHLCSNDNTRVSYFRAAYFLIASDCFVTGWISQFIHFHFIPLSHCPINENSQISFPPRFPKRLECEKRLKSGSRAISTANNGSEKRDGCQKSEMIGDETAPV